jgi:hypothetical protein
MKRRDLADVLIKILGLWQLVLWLPHTILGVIQWLQSGGNFSGDYLVRFLPMTVIDFLIAIGLIVSSRGIAELLFPTKDEESSEP